MWTLLMLALCSSLQEGMRPSHCQSLCSENEKFVNNVNPCNTCENSEVCLFDTDGGPGCDCLPEFYRNKEGKCVPKEECEGGPPSVENGALRRSRPANQIQCRKDEVFLECSCERTCCNGGRTEGCSASCKKGCFCKKGLVRHEDGRCIRLKDCKKEKGENSPGPGFPPVQCSIPKCDDGCSIDYSTKPCPSCSCRDFPSIQCDMPKCDDGCSIDYSTKPCPSCSCPDFPAIQCDIPKCDEDCNIDYSTKPCPSCSCQDSPPVLCSIPNCDAGCNIDYSSKPCPSCSCPALPSPTKCRPDEQYYECIPLCHGTCSAYLTKSYLFCKMACRSGCFCRKGLYKTEDGRCVPASQCTVQNTPENTCGANEEYKECGSACPPTCADRGKKSKKCTKQCVSGCFCKKGFVKNGQGVCVRPQECQKGNPPVQCSPPKCAPGCSIDYSSKPCPSCSCTGNPPVQCSPPKCASGCSIDYSSKPCPSCSCTDTCGANAEYRECGSACPPTCADRGKKNKICTMQCVSGCFCKKGFVKNNRGVCVKPQECEQNTCGENEEYRGCGSACPTTCANLGKNVMCTMQCVPGCYCAKGLVRNDQGKCVRPEECPQNSVATTGNPGDMCTEDEEYQECGSACPSTCENIGKNVPCTLQCVPGCFCKKGLVRNDQGDCVEPEECPQRNCGEDEMYLSCGSACAPTCSTLGRTDFACIALCVPGCFCNDGLVRNDQGECVEPEECPQDVTPIPAVPKDSCREDEVYLTCGSACPPTCSTLRRTDVACISLCVQGCFCRDGLVRNDQGECVEPEECPQSPESCPENEEYSDCASPCNTCSRRGKCEQPCSPGCDCKKGYYRDFQGKCIPKKQCPRIDPPRPRNQCGRRQQFYECIPRCSRTCEAYTRKPKVYCKPLCRSGCFCKEGLYETKDGKCVPPFQCPAVPPAKKCPKNEEYSDCVIPCNDCKTRGNCNFLVCNKGCDCREGYYRDFNGRCILSRQCPQILPTPPVSTCKADEQYYECIPSCDRTCKAYRRKEKIFCNQICISGCFCKDGLYLADDGKTCVPPEQCDKTPSSPTKKCPKNEEYSDCVVPCNDCQTRGKCNFLVCNKGCDCRKGYYRDFNGRCIPARQCPLIDPTPAPADCSPDQQYYECIPRCSRTCKAYTRSVEIFCNQLCVEGCFCKEGLYEAEDGSCVPPEQCSAPTTSSGEQCPENEEYSDCVNPCNDCQTRGNCNFLVCNKGCDCKKGYYRDFDGGDGRCILGLQCPMIGSTPPPNQCGVDEQFYDCIPGCQQTCFALTSEVKIACKMPCRSGCYCREGLYKKDDGTCVQPEECYDDDDTRVTEALPGVTPTKTPNCGKNEEYYRCIPTCKNTCENYQAVKPLCPRICIAGCSCKKGFVKRSDGKCVKPEKCNKSAPTIKPTMTPTKTPSCGTNEEYYGCIPTCKNTCENYQAVKPLCPRICIAGCSCKKGFVKRSDGKCVKPEKCNKSAPTIKPTKPNQQCGPEEQYYSCIPTCKNTCDNYQANHPICPRICRRGCFCKKGLVKRRDGKCVKPEKCQSSAPQPTASLPTSNPTCQLEKEVGPCRASLTRYFYNYRTRQCEKFKYGGCRGNKNNFKTIDECQVICGGVTPTKTPNCGKNEEYYRCIPTCKNTCENYQAVKPLCPRICIAGCSCKKGFVKRSDGKCVKPEKCNKSAPTIKPTSSSPIQCSIPLCRVGCNIDYSTKPCPSCSCSSSTPSPTKCDKDEEYYDCVPNCHNTCDTYNKKGPCPLFCISGCFCKKGMIKNKDGKCVKPSKCPSSNPPSSAPAPASNPDCQQPKEVGPCRAIMPRFFFNQESRQCEQFNYGGCRGNKNNFKTKEDCEAKCGSASPTPPPTPTCGADEQYYQCIPVCRNTCATYNKTNIACPDICESGCFCKEGMVKTEDGTCVSPFQCNVLQPTDGSEECGEDEEYYDDCAPKCTGTCEAYNNPGIYNCPLCKPGCWCSQGLVKRSDGQCVSPDQCDAPNSTEPPDQCGENEEYYEDCAPSCGGTCETYKKLPILNCRLCRPGCWCSKGLVKRKDGKCVPKDQCGAPTDVTPSPADSCGEDEEYQDCGSACPPTCATLGRTDFACLAVCVPGCFCKEGLVRNDQGDCVEPEDCPQKTCSKDEEYKECGSSCPPTCSTLGKRQICTRECVPGCFCREGLVRNDQGECVEPEDCPPDENPQKCGEDEEYTDCGSACPPTCSNIGKDQVCTDQCVPGCFCAEGLVRNEKGECVEPEECPQRNSEECGEDEKYYDCAPSCGGTCDTYNKTAVILCLPCGPGCWCNEGLVKNNEGKCIPPEQCDVPKVSGPHKLCGLNEIYYDECAPSCRGTCETHDQNVECPECVPGCWCKKGYLKNQFGKCVLERKCNMKQKIPQCPKDQQYYDCIPSCKRTCMTYNSTSAYCPKECIMGCFCKEGLVMNKNGECVPPEKCPITCPFNQKYYECMPDCQNRCNPPDACAAVCKSGCFCREGLVMREDGKCVRKNLCKGKNPGKPRCKPDQEYYECFQRCRNSCATRNGVCPAVCESGCFCKKGLLLDSEGNCVEPEECDDISNSAEDGSDENPDSDENSEPDNEPGDEGKCSGVNEEIVSCAKPKTCNTCLIRGNCKLKRCEKGCDCKSGYYRDDSGVCIPQDQCPGATSPSECTGENEEMVSCAKPKWCNTCGIRGNCKLKQCEAGCDCKQGYYRDDSGVCIPEDQCPGDTSSPSTLRCSMPKCDDDCNIDYSTKPCPSCSCPDSSAVQCSMPKCDDDCSIDYSTKPCPSCSCPDLPTIQCSIPKCDEDGCSIDYSTKPCPSCSCAGSPTIQCSIPKCDNDGCSIDYSTKPCPSCSCTSSPTIQCSMPKCDDEGCSIDYSTKPCPSCSCIGSPTIQCSIPKCDDDGCSVDYSTKPCPSCSCTGSPMIQCSIPKCDEDGCSIDYSTKPCPRCSCTGDSNANPANTSGADNENDSPDGSSYSEESFSSTSETESSESGLMNQSADARKKYSMSRSGSRNGSSGNSSGNEIDSKDASESRFSESGSMNQSADARNKYSRSRSGSRNRSSENSSGNEIDSKDASESRFSESGSMSQSADARNKYSRSRSGSRNRSSGNSSGNEIDSKNASESRFSESGSMSQSADARKKYYRSRSGSRSRSSGSSSDNEVNSEKNSSDESEEGTSSMSSDAIDWSSDTSSDSENSSLRFSSEMWSSSISDGNSEENEVDSTDESAVDEDMSSSDSESGYSTMSSDSENEDQNNYLDESSVSEDTTSSDRGSGYSRSSSGSTDWSSANSEKSPSKFQSGSRTRYSKMSSDFDNDEEEQEYEEYYKEDLYEEDEATYKGNGNESEEYSFSWTEYN